MDYKKSLVALVWCCTFIFVSTAAENEADKSLSTRTINDENWYLFPESLLQNGNSNDPVSQAEPIHDVYTVKGSDGDIQRVHYALDEHGLRANIYSKASGHGPNIETNSIELKPRRWPSNDFDFNLEKFLSMHPTKLTSYFQNFEKILSPKPFPFHQDINIGIPNRETRFSATDANTPLSVSSKRLVSKLVPNNLKQMPYIGKTFGEKNSFVNNADNENILKYQAPSVVSSPYYGRYSQVHTTNVFFESQRIPKPIIQSYDRTISSFNNFPNNVSTGLTKNLTDIPITKTEEDEDISRSEVKKSSLNLEVFPSLQTTTYQPGNEGNVESQNIQNASPLSEPVFVFSLTEQTDADTKSNASKIIPSQPVMDDFISMKMKTQIQPNYKSLTPTSFIFSPLSTIFDSNNDEGGPYYHYVMNIGNNTGDTVSELIEKYFKLSNTNEQLNEVKEQFFSGSTKNISRSVKDAHTFNNIIKDELKFKEERLDANENNSTIHFSVANLNESFDIVGPENRSGKISQITLKEIDSRGNEIHNISEAVNGEIMKIVKGQELSSPLGTKNNVTDRDNELKIIPFQLVEIDEIIDTSYSNDSSLNQVTNGLEKHTGEFIDHDSTTGFQSESFKNAGGDIISANTTDFPFLKFSNINHTAHRANEYKEFDTLFGFVKTFTDNMNIVPEILRSDKYNGTLLNSENEELNGIFKEIPENSSSVNDLISQVRSTKESSADILIESYENASVKSNTYYPDKSIINIRAKLNLLRPSDEVIVLNEIPSLNPNKKEGHVLNNENIHPVLEIMIPEAEINDFIMKINNTPVLIRILQPELLASETIPHVFTIQDGDQNFSSKDLETNYNSNFSATFNNIFDLLQLNNVKNSAHSISESILPSKTIALEPINDAKNKRIILLANDSKIDVNFPTETFISYVLDNEGSLKNSSLFQKKSGTIVKVVESATANPESQESSFMKLPIRDESNLKQLVDVYLLDDSRPQDMDKSEIQNIVKNQFYSYVSNIIHNNTFPKKGRIFQSRTKIQPLDIKKFYQLIYKNQPTDMPSGYEIVHKIAHTLSGEDFQSQKSEVNGMITENNIVQNQSIRFKISDDLSSSVQFVVIPYEDFE